MEVGAPRGLLRFFEELEDPRMERTRLHNLQDILFITICGVICGADSWTEVEEFGEVREDWLRQFLDLPNGIPSHDTFGRVFSKLDPNQMEGCFSAWMATLAETSQGRLVAIPPPGGGAGRGRGDRHRPHHRLRHYFLKPRPMAVRR